MSEVKGFYPNYPEYTSKYPELGFYGLPGFSNTPVDVLDQVRHAEKLGIGNVMISERPDYKEAASICGAIAAVTEKIFIGTSATNPNTRHPVLSASMCSTLNGLSRGRFALGIAKGGGAARWKAWGLKQNTYEREREFINILRRLLQGETVSHDGAFGNFPMIKQADYMREQVPLMYVGFGPKSVEHAGSLYDGMHLHTFMSDEALQQSVQRARAGEKRSGRPEGTVKVWSVLATACEVSREKYLKYIIARLSTYLQFPGYGEALVNVNGWDLADLERFRNHPAVKAVPGWIDSVATYEQLEAIEPAIPEHWKPAAIGSPRECAQRWLDQFEAGADGIIIHASTPDEFAPVLEEYAKIRPHKHFDGRTNRPGG